MVSISSHQVYAPRECGGCKEIKQRTKEFINDFSRVVCPDSVKPLIKLTKAFEMVEIDTK